MREGDAQTSWQSLLLELFDAAMRSQWGWGPSLRPGRGTRMAQPGVAEMARVDGGSLAQPYFHASSIVIDFAHRRVSCRAVDQKTPAEKVWELAPNPSWWARAAKTPWPILSK